ncbi:hypothetical protein [Adhaeribacter terreus]|uniref:Uncharacterized protein n=1 Tax=Adhaeribacter terreus TaxID=529703 RepID=A0ABW0ECG6_9BACT
MLSLQFIRIRKERPTEKCLASIWSDACAQFQIPCVLIYLNEETAYITANLKHLKLAPDFTSRQANFNETFQALHQKFTGSDKGYWQHNNYYHTFDAVPKPVVLEMGSAIFRTFAEI